MELSTQELFILAPLEESNKYIYYVRAFADEGVLFPFGENDALPSALPVDLNAYRCVMIDPARREEMETAPHRERLLEFQRRGGFVYYPDLNQPAGRGIGDSHVRHYAHRAINTAGLRMRNPQMLKNLQARDEEKWLPAWKNAAPDELAQYARMGKPFCDPPGYITFRAALEAAEYFEEPQLAEPVWEHLEEHADRFGGPTDCCGGRYFLQRYEQTGNSRWLETARKISGYRRLWEVDGVELNCDLQVPDDCDPTKPPTRVIENAWCWPEMASHAGDTLAYLSNVTGESQWRERAVRHVCGTHRWLFDEEISLWRHVGRPTGPDRRSAPWGRGNCWFLYAVRGLLEDLPPEHQARPQLVEMLRLGLEGFLRFQDEHGMWQNVLDAEPEESRQCASATSRIVHVYARAYWKGWLRDERIPAMLERGWNGLKTKIWKDELFAVCVGTSHALCRQVYLSRPHDTFRVSRSELLLTWMEMQRIRAAVSREAERVLP
jgi:rhamnogalacturonyl hydrolase YesR